MADLLLPLADLETPVGGIASRVLLKAGGGSATVFTFGAGTGLDEHMTPREGLLVVASGEAHVTLGGGETHALSAGDTLRLPARVPHAVHAPVDLRMLLVLLRP